MTTGLELHEACSVGDMDSLEEYVKSGKYDIDMKDPEWHNRTPLHWACARGYVNCINLLLEYGANGISRMDMGWTPAHVAAEAGKLNALRALHVAGVSVIKRDLYKDRPSRLAEIYGHTDCLAFLRQIEQEEQNKRKSGFRSEEMSDEEDENEEEVDPN